jgi:hypothetical protein
VSYVGFDYSRARVGRGNGRRLDDARVAHAGLQLLVFRWLGLVNRMYFAWRWLWERKVMRKAELALGSFRITGMEGPLIKRVSYHFIDNRGEYRGGSLRTLFCDAQDDLTVIFYDEETPEQSVPASAMMFHKLRWLKV